MFAGYKNPKREKCFLVRISAGAKKKNQSFFQKAKLVNHCLESLKGTHKSRNSLKLKNKLSEFVNVNCSSRGVGFGNLGKILTFMGAVTCPQRRVIRGRKKEKLKGRIGSNSAVDQSQ
ncbi:hypothetical protein TNCV_3063831 [Trichonephila clavipes]|nr:hypothetical protein TNCV_3063831 [Trichonephila clavipes]